MSRFIQTGAELNTVTAGVDFDNKTNSPTINSSTPRSGNYAVSATGTSHTTVQSSFASTSGPLYFRFYLYISSATNGTTTIWGKATIASIKLTSANKLQLFDGGAGSQVGSDSSALTNNQWYRIEVLFNATPASGSRILTGYIDGVQFATTSTGTLGALNFVEYGMNIAGEGKTGTLLFDDIAINDNTGSFQNSLPGDGQIIFMKPDSSGDSASWTRGGTDSGANYSQVNEVTPDDIGTYNESTTLNQEDLFNLEDSPSSIGASDTINCVAVDGRFRSNVGSSDPTFKWEIESSSGGTIEQGTGIRPASTSWASHNASFTGNLQLVLYDLPGASTTPWTKADLDTAQIGYKLTTDSTNKNQISTIWLSVDSTPNAGGGGATTTIIPQRMRMGMGA